jgi:hypothetical protein
VRSDCRTPLVGDMIKLIRKMIKKAGRGLARVGQVLVVVARLLLILALASIFIPSRGDRLLTLTPVRGHSGRAIQHQLCCLLL